MGGVHVDSQIPRHKQGTKKNMNLALQRMRNDVFILSQVKVPYKEGTLQNSGQQKQIADLHHRVSYGENGADEYAGYQHRGMRRDGTHVVRNYTTAGTGKDYLEESGLVIAGKAVRYFQQAAGGAV